MRSKRAPCGSTCSTTPLASSGAERLASKALVVMLRGSMIVTAPRPTTLQHVVVPHEAAVSSSMPSPSSCGDWATIISSRP